MTYSAPGDGGGGVVWVEVPDMLPGAVDGLYSSGLEIGSREKKLRKTNALLLRRMLRRQISSAVSLCSWTPCPGAAY